MDKQKKPGFLQAVKQVIGSFSLVDIGRPGHAKLTETVVQQFGGSTSGNGYPVSAQSAMHISAFWSCVRLLSETISTMPLMLYRSNGEGREVASNDPLYRILHDAPNADQTSVEFWEGVMMSLCLWGNAYALKEMIGRRVVALTPLNPQRVVVVREAGRRKYLYRNGVQTITYDEDEIFHVRGFGGGDMGLSTVEYARHTLGGAMATEDTVASLAANGGRPAGVLTYEGTFKQGEREKMRSAVAEQMSSVNESGGIMVLEANMKFQPLSLKPDDAEYLATRQFNIEEICRFFRVPPAMVGHTEKSSSWGTGREQEMISFSQHTLRPYTVRIEKAIARSLIPVEQRSVLTAEFNMEGLLRGDSKGRAAFYVAMVQNGIFTRNEVRRLENRTPLPGADSLTVQAQNVPLDQANALEQEPSQ